MQHNKDILVNAKHDSSRRLFMQKMSAALGVATASTVLSTSAISSALAYDLQKGSELRAGKIFQQQHMMVLKHIVDAILPKTDTPSASDVDCHGFVDDQLFNCYTKQQQNSAKAIVSKIATTGVNGNFVNSSLNQQQQVLRDIESGKGYDKNDSEQFSQLKSLIVFGYFTSEIGATKALNYLTVPGGYKGSIKIDENTKAWGLYAYY